MKEFIEKLIGKIENEAFAVQLEKGIKHPSTLDAMMEKFSVFRIKEIVNQLAEEYNNGWIPYATGAELPLNNQKVWLSFTSQYTSFVKSAWWVNDHFEWNNGRTVKDVPLAWKPYNVPAPYQPKGE